MTPHTLKVIFDTIVAPITGTQPAAVATIRISGPDAWAIARKVFFRFPNEVESHKAIYGRCQAAGSGLALPFAEGHSYTGEESVEISVHGSPVAVRALINDCIQHGARMAEPGEFTQRAFLNGRVDLTKAEAVRDLVNAETEAQQRGADTLFRGGLQREVQEIIEHLTKQLVAVEAAVDFSEEIGELDRTGLGLNLKADRARIERLTESAPAGRILREGLRIAIVGPPNAGKSSLLNWILGFERAIVDEVAGTTRDFVEEKVEIEGILCVLYDTAGLRETSDKVESLGIQRTRTIAAKVDEVCYIYDSSVGWTPLDQSTVESFERPVTILANKCDLALSEPGIPVSAKTGEGLDLLRQWVKQKADIDRHKMLINQRHESCLREALVALDSSIAALDHDLPEDLISVGLRDAIAKLGQITGETATADIIDRIFHDFCIGK
jgi:tRNA modification GTPase